MHRNSLRVRKLGRNLITQIVEIFPSLACRYPKKRNLIDLRMGLRIGLILLLIVAGLTITTFLPRTTPPPPLYTANVDPVLFIHDFAGTSYLWGLDMIPIFKNNGWPNSLLYYYDFINASNPSVKASTEHAFQIKQWVEEIILTTGAKKVDLVAHGTGGLSSRYYIKFLDGISYVDDFLSLGCPHHGVQSSRPHAPSFNEFALSLNKGDETPGGILNDTLGERRDPFNPNITYNGAHISGTINYTSMYVLPDDCWYPGASSILNGAINVELEKISHSHLIVKEAMYKLIIGALDGQFEPESV